MRGFQVTATRVAGKWIVPDARGWTWTRQLPIELTGIIVLVSRESPAGQVGFRKPAVAVREVAEMKQNRKQKTWQPESLHWVWVIPKPGRLGLEIKTTIQKNEIGFKREVLTSVQVRTGSGPASPSQISRESSDRSQAPRP